MIIKAPSLNPKWDELVSKYNANYNLVNLDLTHLSHVIVTLRHKKNGTKKYILIEADLGGLVRLDYKPEKKQKK